VFAGLPAGGLPADCNALISFYHGLESQFSFELVRMIGMNEVKYGFKGKSRLESTIKKGLDGQSSAVEEDVPGERLPYACNDPSMLTPNDVSCPRCSRPINAHAHYCEHCGVDLGIAAAVAEHDLLPFPEVMASGPISPEVLVPRLGDYLIAKGVLSKDDLQQALLHQQSEQAAGRPSLLGQTLLALGLVNRETLDQVVTEQILQLQSALHEANQTLEKRVMDRTAELQQALRRLAELNQLKSNFISNISHELRTPLTHIKGYLELLNDAELGELSADQKHAVGVSLKATGRLERLIEDLLQFSLAVQGELSLKLEYVLVDWLIERLHIAYGTKANYKKIQFETKTLGLPVEIRVDIEKFEWAVGQLLDNALKFTPAGGKVTLSAAHHAGLVTFAVTDTGIGIPDGKIGEIFQLFHQLDGSNTRRYEGTGMGLAFVQRIIESHGSQIKVESGIGQGSTFSLTIPVALR
jgi:signal transduction histidine kinase